MTNIQAKAMEKARDEMVRAYQEFKRCQTQEIKTTYVYRGVEYTK